MYTPTQPIGQTLAKHLEELRKRLMVVSVFIVLFMGIAYKFNETIISIVQAPLDDTLYFTTPGGGFTFILKLCILVALLATSPIFIFQTIRFIQPALSPRQHISVVRYLLFSVVLLVAGALFGYFVSLPTALRFLANFGNESIQALITANEYMNFVMSYLIGFGLLFQLPVIILFINRIKPLTPGGLIKAFRYVVVLSFLLSGILTPTPDPINQGLMAGPIIGMYGLSIGLVAITRRRVAKPSTVNAVNPLDDLSGIDPIVPHPRPSTFTEQRDMEPVKQLGNTFCPTLDIGMSNLRQPLDLPKKLDIQLNNVLDLRQNTDSRY